MAETLVEILQEYKRREKRERVVLSFKIDPQVAQMLSDTAEKTGLSKTAVLEAFIRYGHHLVEEDLEDHLDVEAAQKALAESDERIPYKEVRKKLGL